MVCPGEWRLTLVTTSTSMEKIPWLSRIRVITEEVRTIVLSGQGIILSIEHECKAYETMGYLEQER